MSVQKNLATENFGDYIFFEDFFDEIFFWATSVGCPLGRLAICTLDECLAQLQRIVLKFPGCVHNWAGWRFVLDGCRLRRTVLRSPGSGVAVGTG